MARGKYLSLEEARREQKLKQFAKGHPSESNEEERIDPPVLTCGITCYIRRVRRRLRTGPLSMAAESEAHGTA